MPETKVISTLTDLSLNGTDIAIRTFYSEPGDLPDTLSAFISDELGSQDGTSYIEGKLLIKMKESPEHLSYLIDSNGHLILSINTGDEDNYSINNNGHLIYTVIT